jgi:5-methylcytosine-specific restriction endonuclease McrA
MARRSSEHIKAQKDGKVRDLFTCQLCGSNNKPQGHHIIDVQYGGSSLADNIITLCAEHHQKAHSGKISIFKF